VPKKIAHAGTKKKKGKKRPVESTEPGDPFVFFFVPFQAKDFVEHAYFDAYHQCLF